MKSATMKMVSDFCFQLIENVFIKIRMILLQRIWVKTVYKIQLLVEVADDADG